MKKLLLLLLLAAQMVGFGQTSSPIGTGTIASNPALKYAGLFRYKVKKVNGDTTSQFGWVNTNVQGVIVDSRAKRLNGYFSSTTTALANLPVTYSIGSGVDFQEAKYIAYMEQYPLRDIARTKASYDEMIAAGANEILIPIHWEEVFQTYAAQTTNSGSSWAVFDDLISYAKNKGVKVSLRICVDMDDSRLHPDGGNDFYLLANSAMDEWGNPARIAYGSGHSSLAYSSGRSMMIDFVNKTLSRYNSLLGSQFLWYGVSISAQNEIGYNYENSYYSGNTPVGPIPAAFDYSTHSVAGFRTWLTTKYGNVTALNASWGTSFASISVATPPTSGKSIGMATHEELNLLYANNRGKDWWQWNYSMMRDFIVSCKSAGASYAPNAKFYLEWGAVSDILSARRMSPNVQDMVAISDGMKAQFGAIASSPDVALSLDVIRSNYTKKKSTEINDYDMYAIYGATSVADMKSKAIVLSQSAIQNNAKEIVFITDKADAAKFAGMKEALTTIKGYLTNYSGSVSTTATVNYNLGEWLESYSNIFGRWQAAGGSTTQRVNMVQSGTINYTTTNCTYPLSLYPISSFCLKQNDLKSSQWVESYNSSRVAFNAPTHSITYLGGAKATSSYQIKSTDGVVWLSNVQNTGATNAEYPNNHPSRKYITSLVEDATVYLPIQDYDVVMTNTGTVNFLFEVYNPDPDGLAVSYSTTLVPGATATYRVYASTMNLQVSWKRELKINCNRF